MVFGYLTSKLSQIYNNILISILKNGVKIPKRIGIIMDGNRRYAKKNHLKCIQGHYDGMITLKNILQWSIDLEIEELTVYAFAIDNFKRSEEEVNDLFKLFKENFYKYGNSKEAIESGVRMCIYGKKDLFDQECNNIFKDIEEKTKNGKKIKLNICIGYNSTEEIYQASCKCDKNAENPRKELESHLYGGYNCNLELLIRTSGEIRLSNYMLYQSRFALILFVDKKWPELNLYDYFKILLRYNYNYNNHKSQLKLLEEVNNFVIDE